MENTSATIDIKNENSKKYVNGIILILSCQKHKDTRLKEFSLPKTSYNNWEVIYVIGDLFLEKDGAQLGNSIRLLTKKQPYFLSRSLR